MNHFDLRTGKFTPYYLDSINKRSESNIIFKLCKDNKGNLWLCTSAGLFMFNPITRQFIHYRYNSNNDASGFIFTALAVGDDLWIGTSSVDGLVRLNLSTQKSTYYLSGLEINCIYEDADGVIWIGTSGGLYQYNKKTDSFNSIGGENSGNNILQVLSVTGDKENNLWVSSEFGIYSVNSKRDHVMHFGKEYGIPDANNFFYPSSSFTSLNGQVFFGNNHGYYAFFPDKLNISIGKPQLYFTGFWLDNKQILPDSTSILKQSLYQAKKVRLKHNQNVFAFSTTSVDFRNTADKRIYYKLENYDVDWRMAQPEDKITYFKVPPGNYTFRIKTLNRSNDDWTEKSIAVIILPPWWTTWWAYCIYGISFFVLAFAIYRYQKERVIKAEREKQE